MKKIHKLVMLPNTNKGKDATGLIKAIKNYDSMFADDSSKVGDLSIGVNTSLGVLEYWEPQHLYILSDEKIKEGDWCVQGPQQPLHIDEVVQVTHESEIANDIQQKIIAPTDKSLKIWEGLQEEKLTGKYLFTLPQIPQSFIESYVKNPVEEIELEYEEGNKRPDPSHSFDFPDSYQFDWVLKLTNNEVIISTLEPKLYTEKDMDDTYDKGYKDGVVDTNTILKAMNS